MSERLEPHHHHPVLLAAVSVGGVVGAEARYGLGQALPHPAGTWPWATLLTNLSGSLLVGLLMAALARADDPHQLTRPFFGVGILGGYTTFSTYAVDLRQLLAHGRPALAAAFLVGTLLGALLATYVGYRALGVIRPRRILPSEPG